MGHDPSRSSRDLTPRERRARLQSFNPTDAAFVAHLAGCERCRQHAAQLLPGQETVPSGSLAPLSTVELGIILHLARGGYLLAQTDAEPQDDLPLAELQKFLSALTSQQAEFIDHLIGCERCLQAVARILKPHGTTPPSDPVIAN